MFVTNHVFAGTLIGVACRRRPALAFAAGVASHVVMDLTPHWGDPSLGAAEFYVIARRDGLLGLAALGAVMAAGLPPRRALLGATLGAALLDADKPVQHFFGVTPFPAWVQRFHHSIQRESTERMPLEVAVGVALGAAAAAALRAQRARSR